MKQKAFRQNKTGVAPPLKSLSSAAGTSGHEYALYYVNYLHITFTFARWVYDLPGEICCFLRFFGAGRSRYTATDERSGGNSLARVDLPDPEGPIKAVMVFGFRVRVTSFNARVSPYEYVTF